MTLVYDDESSGNDATSDNLFESRLPDLAPDETIEQNLDQDSAPTNGRNTESSTATTIAAATTTSATAVTTSATATTASEGYDNILEQNKAGDSAKNFSQCYKVGLSPVVVMLSSNNQRNT